MITSIRNRQVAGALKLKKRGIRDQHRRFLVEGGRTVREALDAGVVETLFHVPADRADPLAERAASSGAEAVAVSDRVMDRLASTVTPQGIVAVARFLDVSLDRVEDAGLVPVLCSVRDPGNAGAILRSSDAAGADAVVFAGTSVDPYNEKTVRASAGSLFHLPIVRGVEVKEAVDGLRSRGAAILAAAPDGERSVYETDLAGPTAILFGNEARGLDPDHRALADASVRVPIHGRAESLNLAASAALILFEATRQRSGPAPSDGAALFVASAHDLRSPLTALTGFAHTLLSRWDALDEERRRELVGGLVVDAERTSATVRLVLDAVRASAGRLELRPERHDLADDARWVAQVFGAAPEYPDVAVEGSAEAASDVERVRAALVALCEAAAGWGDQGVVRVAVGTHADGAVVEVARAGQDVTPGQAGKLLRPPQEGGIPALHAARLVAEAHGGSLECDAGNGIRFRLVLPVERGTLH